MLLKNTDYIITTGQLLFDWILAYANMTDLLNTGV